MSILWKICLLFGQHTVDCISHKSPHNQNRHQKVFNGGALFRGLDPLCSGRLIFCSLIKTSPISSASQFNLWAWRFVWGAWPPKSPRDDGTAHNYHSLYILGFGSVGSFVSLFVNVREAHGTMDLLCFPW